MWNDLLRIKYALLVCIFSITQVSYSQSNSHVLKVVPVVSFYEPPTSFKKVTFQEDELEEHTSSKLGDVLQNKSSVYIKNYGKGQLQSISFRGTSASQTKVFWNGFVMNSPSLGQTDLSLYPTFFINKLSLNYGASSIINGSGGLGGSVQMDNNLNWAKGIHFLASHEYASFNNHTSTFKLNFVGDKQKASHEIKLYKSSGKNDFPYTDISQKDRPTIRQHNNEVNQEGVQYLLQIGNPFKNSFSNLKLGGFYFNSNRNLPPIIGASPKGERQWDEHFRAFADWNIPKLLNDKLSLNSRVAYVHENMIYVDSASQIYSPSTFTSIQPQLNLNYRFNTNKKRLQTVFLGNMSKAKTTGFDGDYKNRNEVSALAKWEQSFNKLGYDVMLRQSTIDGKLMPFTFGTGATYRLINTKLLTTLTFGKNFRYPTLNDLYWNPGGNENLKPETSYNTDFGLKGSLFKYAFTYKINAFYSVVDNWIQWVPTANNYWAPQNIKKVHSRGVELQTGYTQTLPKNMLLNIKMQYGYTKSTAQEVTLANDQSIGKQLIYVPLHKASLKANWITNYFTLSYNQIVTSKVFIDATNSVYLPGYAPANVQLSSKLLIKKYSVEINLSANNIFNEPYQVVANRPIPGRNYGVTLRVGYN